METTCSTLGSVLYVVITLLESIIIIVHVEHLMNPTRCLLENRDTAGCQVLLFTAVALLSSSHGIFNLARTLKASVRDTPCNCNSLLNR